ncbi:MAG: adenylyl-sulfate reductase subunit alpha [Oscillospiraceae bacterium]|nr:adenylyl-sulfate reductase subunit alpha [Oscillospiraceae bacterium]
MPLKQAHIHADVLIIGGGTAGCYAALTASRLNPKLKILVAEKANIRRSGCLAAGVNAINAYITPGQTPEDYLEFVRWDAAGLIRDDLVLSMAREFNQAVEHLERLGLVILKDETGAYVSRGRQNIKINGENIKPILARAVAACPNVQVLNHVNLTDYLTLDGPGSRVVGAAGFSVGEAQAYFLHARAVLCATGGAAGLYRPNNPGFSRHKMWYPPFNAGAGYAMGLRAGAEMTSFEMRFVAQRCKDTIAPTGTLALGVEAKEVNALGENFESRYGLSTSGRAYGVTQETLEGRGPCYLQTQGIAPEQDQQLLRAYLNMAPSQALKWIESEQPPSQQNVEIEGSEPYVVGGHTGSGYWVDTGRRTTLPGLYAAGDVAGGAPKKFVSGALAEGKLAAQAILADLVTLPSEPGDAEQQAAIFADYQNRLSGGSGEGLYTADQLEQGMQKAMDVYAGGISTAYRYSARQLDQARDEIEVLSGFVKDLGAADTRALLRVYELKDRLLVCRGLLAHLLARKETRWPGFGVNLDYPEPDPAWERQFVNSRLEGGDIRTFVRRVEEGGERYEHTDPA